MRIAKLDKKARDAPVNARAQPPICTALGAGSIMTLAIQTGASGRRERLVACRNFYLAAGCRPS